MIIMRCIKFNRICAVLCAMLAIALASAASAEVVEVSNGTELYWALLTVKSGTIKLAPGDYDITEPPVEEGERIREFYGVAYELIGAEGLEIIGAGIGKTNVVLSTPELIVMTISQCKDLKISGITFGHVPMGNEVYCSGNVLNILDCERVTLEDVDLFGCGVVGLHMVDCRDVSVVGSLIRDCSDSLVTAAECSGVRFSKTRFRHREDAYDEALSIWSKGRSELTFDGCDFAIPQSKFISLDSNSHDAVFTGATFYGGPREDDLASIASAHPSIRFDGSVFKSADGPGVEGHFGGPDPNGGR